MSEVVVNGRFRHQRMTGIQRVAQAITSRLQIPHTVIEPRKQSEGIAGHAWEQFVLPVRAKGRLIWGPCNTGPLFGAPQVLTIHGAAVFDHPEWFSPQFARMNHALWPRLAKRARKIVTVSHFSKERLMAVLGLRDEAIEVIWNGVDPHFNPASEEKIETEKAKVGIGGRPYFATLSTLEPRKNLSLVLRAWDKVRSQLPHDTALLVIGGKGKKGVFKNGGAEEVVPEGVVFSGYVAEEALPALLSGAWGVLYPSIYEGFGLPVLEAMACGAPAVTTFQTSLPEVGGDAALYVDPFDHDDLGRVLVKLAESKDLRDQHSRLGLERAKLFTWDEAAARMDKVLARFA